MENNLSLPVNEATAFEEYKRKKRVLEVKSKLKNMEPTLLRRGVTMTEIRAFCARAKNFSPACVLVQPMYVKSCRLLLQGSGIGVSCNVGGNSESIPSVKIYECRRAIFDGATEIDYTPCSAYIVNGNFAMLKKEIRRVMRVAHGRLVKIQLGDGTYTEESFLKAAQTAVEAGAKYISIPADDHLLIALQDRLHGKCKVKVRGVKSAETFYDMFALNCSRIGCDSSEDIICDMQEQLYETAEKPFPEENMVN